MTLSCAGVARPLLGELPLDPEAERLGVFDHTIEARLVEILRARNAAVVFQHLSVNFVAPAEVFLSNVNQCYFVFRNHFSVEPMTQSQSDQPKTEAESPTNVSEKGESEIPVKNFQDVNEGDPPSPSVKKLPESGVLIQTTETALRPEKTGLSNDRVGDYLHCCHCHRGYCLRRCCYLSVPNYRCSVDRNAQST
jgi:hypothetical protein